MPVDTAEAKDLELFHYGIKGMKWGVRRPEGPDGTVSSGVAAKRTRGEDDSENYTTSRSLKKNPISTLSNQELQDVVTRMNLEQQYNRLNPKKTSKGRKIVEDALTEVTKQVVKDVVKQGVEQGFEAIKRGIEKKLNK